MLHKFFNQIDYQTLIILSLGLALAPFFPEPHLFKKTKMLFDGTLTKTIDIFDLFFHSIPIILLLIKISINKSK